MSWSVAIDWDGLREVFEDLSVEVLEEVSVLTLTPEYTPRTFRFEVPFGDLVKFRLQGHNIDTMRVQLRHNGKLMSTSPVVGVLAGREGQTSIIEIADEPIRAARTIPPRRDMRITAFDADATAAANQADADYIDLQFAAAYGSSPSSFVFHDLPPLGYGVKHQGGAVGAVDVHINTSVPDSPSVAYAAKIEGMTYQLVFGRPGVEGVPAVRGYLIDASTDTIMVAGHQLKNGTVTVTAITPDGERFSRALTTVGSRDQVGRSISVVDCSDIVNLDAGLLADSGLGAEWDWYVAFDGTAEGLPGDAASVLGYMVAATSGLRVDVSSLSNLRPALRGWRLDRVVDETVSPWPSIVDEILPMLPVALLSTPWGVGFRYVNLRPTQADASFTVEEGTDFVLADKRVDLGGRALDIVNQWRVRFGLNKESGAYSDQVVLGPGTHVMATVSASVLGIVEQTFDASWVSSKVTAGLVCKTLLDKTSGDWLSLEFVARPATHGIEGDHPLEAAQIVRLASETLGVTDALAMVTGLRRRGSSLRVTLTIIDPRYS